MKRAPVIIVLVVLSFICLYSYKKPQFDNKIYQTLDTVEEIRSSIAPKPTVILSDGLPDFHLIKTAFVPQAPEKLWSQPWQDACEEAALLTVNYYYQSANPSLEVIVSDLNKIFDYESLSGWSHDVNLKQMATIAKNLYVLDSQIVESPSIEDIKAYISKNVPVIVPANGKTLYKENKHFKSGGPWYHNLVILGYDDPKQQFIVHDVGTQFGAYFHYSYNLLLDSIHDFPDSGIKEDIDFGAKNVLVLLK